MLSWTPDATNAEQNARDILSAAMWMHTTFKDEVWLWRGQANKAYGIEPGMHSRVLNAPSPLGEELVRRATVELLATARGIRLDRQGENTLPDLALLAHLQHYGAATPLLDVTTDPLIALWMIAFANATDPDGLDDKSGRLIGIRRPPQERWISPLDARPYWDETRPSVAGSFDGQAWWYQAPDVTERLRIQRGSFLIGPLMPSSKRAESTLPLTTTSDFNWLEARMKKRGMPSNTARSTSDVFSMVVRGSTKRHLRRLLEDRSGLSLEAIYPTPWHRPYISQFSQGYGRMRSLALDINMLPSSERKSESDVDLATGAPSDHAETTIAAHPGPTVGH